MGSGATVVARDGGVFTYVSDEAGPSMVLFVHSGQSDGVFEIELEPEPVLPTQAKTGIEWASSWVYFSKGKGKFTLLPFPTATQ